MTGGPIGLLVFALITAAALFSLWSQPVTFRRLARIQNSDRRSMEFNPL
jgi:hypothetical protein